MCFRVNQSKGIILHHDAWLTVNLQVAAVLFSLACQYEVVSGFDLKVLPFILILKHRHAQSKWLLYV